MQLLLRRRHQRDYRQGLIVGGVQLECNWSAAQREHLQQLATLSIPKRRIVKPWGNPIRIRARKMRKQAPLVPCQWLSDANSCDAKQHDDRRRRVHMPLPFASITDASAPRLDSGSSGGKPPPRLVTMTRQDSVATKDKEPEERILISEVTLL